MRRYLRLIAALMALLTALSPCAMAEDAAPAVQTLRAAAEFAAEIAEPGTEASPGPEEQSEGEPEGESEGEDDVLEDVDPDSEAVDLAFGETDTETDGDIEGGQDATPEQEAPEDDASPEPSQGPEPSEALRPCETPETVTAEPSEEPEPLEAPETTEVPETIEAPEPSEGAEVPATPEPTAMPEVTLAPTPADTPEPTPVPGEILAEAASATAASEASHEEAPAEASAPVAVKLGVGETFAIPEIAGTEEAVYTSANARVATVSAAGVIKGKKRGSTTVVATRGETSVEYAVSVVKAPKKIKFTKKKVTLGFDAGQNLGEQAQLAIKLTAGSSSKITYYGYNRGVVSVSEDGVVTAVGVGTTKVTARTYNKKKAKITVKVLPAPGSVALKTTSLNLGVGGVYAMKWTLPKKTASAMQFTSDNPDCVTVDGKGVMTAVAEGEANVAYSCFNGVQGVCAVRVLSAAETVTPLFTSIAMGLKEKSVPVLGDADPNAVCGGVTFSSTNKKVATVSASGVIKAKKKGSATIKIKAGNGSRASVKVRVYKAPTRLTLNPGAVSVEVLGTAQLSALLPKGQAGAVQFTSSDPNVAQVDAAGMVTGLNEGSAVITARTYNGKTAKTAVEVVAPDVMIIMADVARINTKDYTYFPIEAELTNGQFYKGTIHISIEPADVAVYENGRLLGLRGGQTAVLTARVGSETRSCAVIVEDSAKAKDVKAIAHRGSIHWQENTLEAFRNFASTGADGVELDIRSTRDGVQVVFHDATFYAEGAAHTLANETYEAAKALMPSLCTLDEALDVIAETGREIYMNPKDTADGAKCVQAIRARGLQSKTLYFCGTDSLLRSIYAADASATLGYTLSSGAAATGDEILNKARSLHASYIVPHKSLMSQEVVDFWHNNGYKICVWTVNDKSTLTRLCNMGVESILTDYPEYCIEARAGG